MILSGRPPSTLPISTLIQPVFSPQTGIYLQGGMDVNTRSVGSLCWIRSGFETAVGEKAGGRLPASAFLSCCLTKGQNWKETLSKYFFSEWAQLLKFHLTLQSCPAVHFPFHIQYPAFQNIHLQRSICFSKLLKKSYQMGGNVLCLVQTVNFITFVSHPCPIFLS